MRRKDACFVYRTVNVFLYPKLIIVWTARCIKPSLTRRPLDFKKPVDFSCSKPIDKRHHTKQVAIKTIYSSSCGQLVYLSKAIFEGFLVSNVLQDKNNDETYRCLRQPCQSRTDG